MTSTEESLMTTDPWTTVRELDAAIAAAKAEGKHPRLLIAERVEACRAALRADRERAGKLGA